MARSPWASNLVDQFEFRAISYYTVDYQSDPTSGPTQAFNDGVARLEADGFEFLAGTNETHTNQPTSLHVFTRVYIRRKENQAQPFPESTGQKRPESVGSSIEPC